MRPRQPASQAAASPFRAARPPFPSPAPSLSWPLLGPPLAPRNQREGWSHAAPLARRPAARGQRRPPFPSKGRYLGTCEPRASTRGGMPGVALRRAFPPPPMSLPGKKRVGKKAPERLGGQGRRGAAQTNSRVISTFFIPNVVSFVALPVTLLHFFENSHLPKRLRPLPPPPTPLVPFLYCVVRMAENPRG